MASDGPGSPNVGPGRSVGIVADRRAISVVVPEVEIGIVQGIFVAHVVDVLIRNRLGTFCGITIGDCADRTLLDNPDLCIAAGKDKGGYQYSGYVFEMCHDVLRFCCCLCHLLL